MEYNQPQLIRKQLSTDGVTPQWMPTEEGVVVSQPQSLSDDHRYVCHPWSKIWKKEKKRWKEL